MEQVPKETETIAVKRTVRITKKLLDAKGTFGTATAWWTNEAVEILGLGVIVLLNLYLVLPFFKVSIPETSYSGPIIPFVAKIFSIFGINFSTPDKSGVRDYIHVTDIANAHIKAMTVIDTYCNQTYNLGSESGYSVLEVIKKTEELFNKKINFSVQSPRNGDPATLVATCNKAIKQLGWYPQKTIKDIILSAYKWRESPKF